MLSKRNRKRNWKALSRVKRRKHRRYWKKYTKQRKRGVANVTRPQMVLRRMIRMRVSNQGTSRTSRKFKRAWQTS